MTFKPGDQVKVTVYGVEKFGTVTRNPGNGIVFVRMDDTGRERWHHAESLLASVS